MRNSCSLEKRNYCFLVNFNYIKFDGKKSVTAAYDDGRKYIGTDISKWERIGPSEYQEGFASQYGSAGNVAKNVWRAYFEPKKMEALRPLPVAARSRAARLSGGSKVRGGK